MAGWKTLLVRVATEAVTRSPAQKTFWIRTELTLAAVVAFATAAGFAMLGLYLWLWSEIGAIEAAFVLGAGFIALGVALLITARIVERRKKARAAPDPALLAYAFLEGLVEPRRDDTAPPRRRR